MKPSIGPVLAGAGVFPGLGMPRAKAAAAALAGALAFASRPTVAAALALSALGRLRPGSARWTMADQRFGAIASLMGHALPMSAACWLSAEAGAGFTALAITLRRPG